MSENFPIVVEIDATKAKGGADKVDAELVGMERQAKVSSKAMSKAIAEEMRAAARAATAHTQQIVAQSRIAAREGKLAARDEARARVAAQREAATAARATATAAKQAAAEQAAAQRALAQEVARTTREYQKQQASAEAAFGGLKHRRAGGRRLGDLSDYGARASGGGNALAAGVGRYAMGAAAAFGASEAIALADSYTNASNRIRTLTKDTAELSMVQGRLFQVAQATGSEFSSTVELYQKVGKSALAMGRSQEQAIGLTELITKAIKASGAEGASATAAIIQLGQALDSGTLRGEEFNSVNEQAPVLLDLLGKSIGKTRGELRKMAEAGELTSDVVIKALEDSKTSASVNEMWAKRVATLGESFTRFRNELSRTFGEMAANTNVAELFATVLGSVAAAIKGIADVVGVAAAGVAALNDALGGIPIDALKTVISYGKYTIPVYGQLILANDAFKSPGPAKGTGFDARTPEEFEEQRRRAVGEQFDRDVRWRERLANPGLTAAREAEEARRAKEERDRTWAAITARPGSSGRSMVDKRMFDPDAYVEADAKDKARVFLRDATAKAEALVRNTLPEGLGGVDRPEDKTGGGRKKKIEEETEAWSLYTAAIQEVARWQANLRGEFEHAMAFQGVLDSIKAETELIGMSNEERTREVEARRIINDLREQGVYLSEAETAQLRAAIDAQEDAREASEALAKQRREEADATKRARDHLRELVNETMSQLEQASKEMEEMAAGPVTELKQSIGSELAGGFDTALRALFNFRDGFREAMADMAREIAILITKLLLLQAIRAGFGASAGGAGGSGLGAFLGGLVTGNFGNLGMAHGGTYIAGGSGGVDSRNVMFRVTPGERITFTPPGQMAPANSNTGGGAPSVSVPLSIHLGGDLNALVTKHLSSPEGEQIVIDIVAKHAGKLRGALAR
jgi:tape measure domain-containing protein